MHDLGTDLRKIPIFSELDTAEISKIGISTTYQTYPRKTRVFMEGEQRTAVYFIRKGVIKVYKIDINGNEQIINFLTQGDMFPHVGFFEQTPYPATAEAVSDAELLVIPIKAFEQAILEMPTIAIKVMRVMGAKIKDLQSKLQTLGVQEAHVRIVSFLLRLANEHGKETADGIDIDLGLTHQEIASMANTTRETVTRVLTQLKKRQLLTMDRRKIRIIDAEALKQLV